ncbi:MAG: MFS transporter [Patescibacteria group bacterium]
MAHYFKGRISQGFVALYSGRTVLRVAAGLVGLFLPIFLYELFNLRIQYVIYYYLIGHLLYGLTVAWGCKYLNKIGLRRSLRISIIWGSLYYVIFYFLGRSVGVGEFMANQKIIILICFSIVVITLDRLMYWVPLHTDLAKFTNKKNRAKQLSLIESTAIFLQAVMPLVAGWILIRYNYNVLFLIAIFIYLSSLIPFMTLPRTKERFSWTYRQTWREFFSKKRRSLIFAYMGDGAENVVGIIIWPIFIWELLLGNYFQVGALTSLIVGVTIILQLLLGKYADMSSKTKMIKIGSILYAFGWIFKIFIFTAFQIFIVSTYHNLTKIFARTPFDALSYEIAADQGHYVDEYTVIHEMAIQFGKVLMLILILTLTLFFNIQWTFILAALASLTMNFLADSQLIDKGRNSR